MIAWSHGLPEAAAQPACTASPPGRWRSSAAPHDAPAGIVMRDLTPRFAVPFTMPSGRRQDVLLSLEHLLGDDEYLLARGLDVALGYGASACARPSGSAARWPSCTSTASSSATSRPTTCSSPSGAAGRPISFIDCDSMVFRGRQALPTVQTADWQLPRDGARRPGRARPTPTSSAWSCCGCSPAPTTPARSRPTRHMPEELREPLSRALGPEPARRPAAAEWQRALEHASASPAIGALYPGPVPRPARRACPGAACRRSLRCRAGPRHGRRRRPPRRARAAGRAPWQGIGRPAGRGMTPLALGLVAIAIDPPHLAARAAVRGRDPGLPDPAVRLQCRQRGAGLGVLRRPRIGTAAGVRRQVAVRAAALAALPRQHHLEPSRPVHALDPLELDVRGRRGPGDEGDRPPGSTRRAHGARSPRAPRRRSARPRTTHTCRSGTSVSARRP